MNVLTGKDPLIKLKEFNGLWSRGSYYDCPIDHLTDCYNCTFPGKGQVTIRESFSVQNILGGRSIISFAVVTVASGAALLTLNSDGKFYDETHAILLDDFGPGNVDDFVHLDIYGRSYISFKLKGKAAPLISLRYYNGINLAIAGDGTNVPILMTTLAQVGAGNVDPGIHKVSYAYVSPTGYITRPAPLTSITSTGNNRIEITGIPINPFGVGYDKVLLITRANEEELFFIPGGTISGSTIAYNYNGYDTSLINSADYLNNILGTIGSVSALKFYRGRMILIGISGTPDDIYASDVNSPETFNLATNIVKLPVDYGINTSNGGMIIRSILYVTKPNGTYSIQDNGGNPNTWGVDIVDSGLGAYDAGISLFASSMSAQDVLDSCLLINKRGLLHFSGVYSDIPLTYKIQSLWDIIDPNLLYKVQVAHDVWSKRVYIACPLKLGVSPGKPIVRSTSFENEVLLMMDYGEGLTPATVKWSVWTGFKPLKKVVVENFTLNYTDATMIYQLALSLGGTTIYKLAIPVLSLPPAPDDLGSGLFQAIQQSIFTHPIELGGNGTFTCIDMNMANGNGNLLPSLYNGRREIGPIDQKTFRLDVYGSIGLQRLINFTGEHMQVQLSCDLSNPNGFQGYFWLTSLNVYGNVMYKMRPSLIESL